MITRVGVVVPAHDEGLLLAGCLTALLDAAGCCPVPVDLVVVLDDCRDESADICDAFGVRAVVTDVRNVGRARALGVAALTAGWDDPQQLWLSGTDADSVVPPAWLTHQIALADRGADLVLGVVDIEPGSLDRETAVHYLRRYAGPAVRHGHHPHVHGANLGVRASSYLAVGGYPPLANHEDHALVDALVAHPGTTVVRTRELSVRTSSRLQGRCAEGFASHLRLLSPSTRQLRAAAPSGHA